MQLEEFVRKQLELVALERQEEMAAEDELLKSSAKSLQDKGLALHKVYLASRSTGMYGRRVLEFETYQRAKDLPANSMSPGDIVGIFLQQQPPKQVASGIVTKVLARSVLIAVEPDLGGDGGGGDSMEIGVRFSLIKLGSDVTFKRLKKGLNALLRRPPALADLLLGDCSLGPTRDPPPGAQAVKYFNANLDDSQRAAVQLGMRRDDVVLIHGPPGTGKTTTLVELVLQLVARGERLLCCAPSNTAVDNLTERLIAAGVRCVRLGHPARQLPHVAEHSLDALMARSEDRRIISDVRADIDRILGGGGAGRRDRRIGAELSSLRTELRQREVNCVRTILGRTQAVLCTLTVGGLNDDPTLREAAFDATVIDECSQATEAACWLALPRARKCILAGDPHQLPPTVCSERAAAEGLSVTLMERLLPLAGEATQLLTVQYRMHADIMRWSSDAFYAGRLTAHASVAGHRLADLPGFAGGGANDDDDDFPPVLLVDTSGCDLGELETEDAAEMSKANPGEAAIVAEHVAALVDAGLDPRDIAVISPYNLQVEGIRLALEKRQSPNRRLQGIEVRSVDGFQGREKEAVVISLVRSNRRGVVGFLAEHRRLNVAVTRARRHLCVIGDCETVRRGDAMLAGFVDFLLARARVRSATEYAHVLDDIVMPAAARTAAGSQGQSKQQQQRQQREQKRRELLKKRSDAEARLEGLLGLLQLAAARGDWASLAAPAGTQDCVTITAASEGPEGGGSLLHFAGLNPYERARLHEECDRLGLQHRSVDSGGSNDDVGGRVLLVSRASPTKPPSADVADAAAVKSPTPAMEAVDPKAPPAEPFATVEAVADDAIEEAGLPPQIVGTNHTVTAAASADVVEAASSSVKAAAVMVSVAAPKVTSAAADRCAACGKPVPPGNAELHRLACDRAARNRQLRSDVTAAAEAVEAAEKGRKSKKGAVALGGGHSSCQTQQSQAQPSVSVEATKCKNAPVSVPAAAADDLDALLAEFTAMDAVCGQAGCAALVRTVGHTCGHCRRRYCFAHFVPESHGCGQAAREAARRGGGGSASASSAASSSAAAPPKSAKEAIRRGHLQRRLDAKVADMEQARRPAEQKKKPKK